MLRTFIKEYKGKFLNKFEDNFQGRFERFSSFMQEPSFKLSSYNLERINFLSSLFYEALNIAIVGQFSSGKSSFINTLLGDEVLPTGLVPVTAKLTYIKYAKLSFLEITYEDGRREIKDLSDLKFFVDQRTSLEKVKNITIYHNNSLLKKASFIDSPGLNSLSQEDSQETQSILNEVACLFWITLIQNAARLSESYDLDKISPKILKNSLCLLSQKDKITEEEKNLVLAYAKDIYKDKFQDILAISSKEEKEGKEDSGFKEVFDFLNKVEDKKETFIKQEVEEIFKLNVEQFEYFLEVFQQVENILESYPYKEKISAKKESFKAGLKELFSSIKDISMFIALELTKFIKEREKNHFLPSQAFLKKGYFEKKTYRANFLNSDQALTTLVYNDEKLSREFKKLNRLFSSFKEELEKFLDELYQILKQEMEIFANKFENINALNKYSSEADLNNIKEFASSSYFTILKAYEDELYKRNLENSLFFTKLSIKISTNYQNSIKESIYFFEEKIRKSYEYYEENPSFSPYYPQIDEIYQRILTNLSFYEFEDDLIGNKTQIDKIFATLEENFEKIKEEKFIFLENKKAFYKDKISKFKEAEEEFFA